jgi:hypothetical protein
MGPLAADPPAFVNFDGFHEIQASGSQMLVLLLMSWFVADQFVPFSNNIVRSGRHGFDALGITVGHCGTHTAFQPASSVDDGA